MGWKSLWIVLPKHRGNIMKININYHFPEKIVSNILFMQVLRDKKKRENIKNKACKKR